MDKPAAWDAAILVAMRPWAEYTNPAVVLDTDGEPITDPLTMPEKWFFLSMGIWPDDPERFHRILDWMVRNSAKHNAAWRFTKLWCDHMTRNGIALPEPLLTWHKKPPLKPRPVPHEKYALRDWAVCRCVDNLVNIGYQPTQSSTQHGASACRIVAQQTGLSEPRVREIWARRGQLFPWNRIFEI